MNVDVDVDVDVDAWTWLVCKGKGAVCSAGSVCLLGLVAVNIISVSLVIISSMTPLRPSLIRCEEAVPPAPI